MKITLAEPKPWMYDRYDEISTLVDNILAGYDIQGFDDYVETHGPASYNATAARLHNRLYTSVKTPCDMVDFVIPKN